MRIGAGATVLLVLLTLAPACRLTRRVGADNTVRIVMSDSGQLHINGEPAPMERLARRLRAMGARSDTLIRVTVPDDVAPRHLAQVTRELASAGFRKVLFTKPMTADAYTSP